MDMNYGPPIEAMNGYQPSKPGFFDDISAGSIMSGLFGVLQAGLPLLVDSPGANGSNDNRAERTAPIDDVSNISGPTTGKIAISATTILIVGVAAVALIMLSRKG